MNKHVIFVIVMNAVCNNPDKHNKTSTELRNEAKMKVNQTDFRDSDQ